MLRRFALLFVCAILPLSLASADGFPSRPTFQTVTVRDDVTVQAGGEITVTEADGAGSIVVSGSTISKPDFGFLQILHDAGGVIRIATTSELQLEGDTNVFVNGQILPTMKSATFTNAAVTDTSDPTTSLTRTGTGEYRITWGIAFATAPICTVSGAGASGASLYAKIATTFSDRVNVLVANGVGGTVMDIPASTNVNLICVR